MIKPPEILRLKNCRADILVVDDTPANLRLLITILREHSYKARPVINGNLAIEAVKVSPPDLILLDILMPEIDGYQVCTRLKADPRSQEIPVIFLSALSEGLDKSRAFAVGGADFISKPFQVEEVLARIENQLRVRSLQLQLRQQNAQLQQQIKERQQTEKEIRLLLAANQAISYADDFNSALDVLFRLICNAIEWDLGEAWVESDDSKVLECSQGRYASDSSYSEFRQKSWQLTFALGVGLPGRIWLSKQPEWIEDISVLSDQFFRRSQVATAVGLKAAFGVPILDNDRVLAVLIFFNKEAIACQPRLVELVNAIATQLGSAIQRKQAEEALRIAEQRYHSIVENALEGIYQSTPAGCYLSVNPALAKIYGYDSPKDLLESVKDISQQIYVDRNRHREFMAAMEADNAIFGFESLVYRKDSKPIWISETARAVRDAMGRLLYCEGTVSDITERKLAREALKFQREQTELLLLSILPQPIAIRLQTGERPIADYFEEVSVLFADLVGFTEFSAQKTPREMVEILNQIFSQFDRLAQHYGLEKIKTIGDAYMVVGGLPTPRPDHASAIAQMSLDMQEVLLQFNINTGASLQLRIGINIGSAVAGVIGVSKFIYDLWGDTVNVASRMESSAMPGKIQVTAAIYQRLSGQFLFEERGAIAVKGKGEMLTYWLIGK